MRGSYRSPHLHLHLSMLGDVTQFVEIGLADLHQSVGVCLCGVLAEPSRSWRAGMSNMVLPYITCGIEIVP